MTNYEIFKNIILGNITEDELFYMKLKEENEHIIDFSVVMLRNKKEFNSMLLLPEDFLLMDNFYKVKSEYVNDINRVICTKYSCKNSTEIYISDDPFTYNKNKEINTLNFGIGEIDQDGVTIYEIIYYNRFNVFLSDLNDVKKLKEKVENKIEKTTKDK